MDKRYFVPLIMLAAMLMLAYRMLFTDAGVEIRPWYQGQDITEPNVPIPFNARQPGTMAYPQRDDSGDLPSDVYRAYIESAAANYFELALLTDESQMMFASQQPSVEQLRNSVALYHECTGMEEGAEGDLAVLRYPADQRLCDPVLMRRETGHWRIDFVAMRQAIQHNHRNQWHFITGQPPEGYQFAFQGWSFDAAGYPINQ
jgi:hypothetical protein